MMGSGITPSEVASQYGGWSGWYKGEHSQHGVTISKPFYIQTTNVTIGQLKYITYNGRLWWGSHERRCSDCPASFSWDAAQKFI